MRRATGATLQRHQILRLPRKMTTQNLTEICSKQLKSHLQCAADPSMIGPWSKTEPVSPQHAAQPRLLFALATSILYGKNNISRYCAGQEKWHLNFTNTAPAPKSDIWTWPKTAPATLLLDSAMTWLYYYLTLLLLASPSTWLRDDLTLLLLASTTTWRCDDLTLLIFDSTITWRCDDLTLLLFNSVVLLYFMLRWLDSTNIWIYYYLTLRWLDSTNNWLY